MTVVDINKVVDDLLIKRPVGPRGTVTYTVTEDYSYEKYKDVKTYTPNHSSFEYDDLTLFKLNLHDRNDVERYVRVRFYEGKSDHNITRGQRGGVTRKTNRLWSRISSSVASIQSVGACGVYSVKCGRGYYGSQQLGHIHANSMDDALCKAEILFSYLKKEDESLSVSFLRLGDPSDMNSLNDTLKTKIKGRISALKDEIESNKQKIERNKAKLQALSLVQLHEIASMDVAGVAKRITIVYNYSNS